MLALGTPIPWDLCTGNGNVMFRKGFVCNTDEGLARIAKLGLYFEIEEAGAVAEVLPTVESGPLGEIESLADQLDHCCMEIIQSPRDAAGRISNMALAARQLYSDHPSACLAAVHFRHNRPSSCLHPVYNLFLVELLAPALMLGKEAHLRLSHVALTANLGMYEFQDQWADQAGPLSEEQKQLVRHHPEVSVERLKAVGVNDPIWFGIVRQHHERADGSGYPLGLSGDKVLREALVLGMIDRYLSFVMPRTNRKWTHPTAALKIIHEDAAAYGMEHIKTFIQQLGVYPPGTSVRLSNGEIAVVIQHEVGKSAHPRVKSVLDGNGARLARPTERDTARSQYRINGLYLPDAGHDANPATLIDSWT